MTSLKNSVLFLITKVNFPRFLLKNYGSHFQQMSFDICIYDILKVTRNLNPNKANGHNMISIRMLKTCEKSIRKPLGIIFRSSEKTISKS